MTVNNISNEKTSIEFINSDATGLIVEAEWRSDRFVHQIGVLIAGTRHIVLRSREGEPADRWPCSPPLQQLHKQLIEDNPALLAVGMSGLSHYSTSFLLTFKKAAIELQIDSACNVAKTENQPELDQPELDQQMLGVTYLVDDMFEITETASSTLTISHAETRIPDLIVEVAEGKYRLEKAVDGRQTPDQLRIFPRQIHHRQATQWKYRIWFA